MNDESSAILMIKDDLEYKYDYECNLTKSGKFVVDTWGRYFTTSSNGYEKTDLIERDVVKLIDKLRKEYNIDFDYVIDYNSFILIPLF